MTPVRCGSLEQFEPRGKPLMDVHPQDDGTDDDNLASSILYGKPRLSAKTNSQATKDDEHWCIREVANGHEELYSRGKCVYWTRNSLIIKSFNFTDQVVKVFWSEFKRKDTVCIALTSGLSVFNRIGQHFQIPLPFVSQDMYPTKLGIIIERNCDPLDDSSLPNTFALTNPTQEISPVLFKSSLRGAHNNKTLAYSIPSSMSIVATHSSLPLCLIYNSQECQHSIWKIRPTTNEEVDDYQRLNDDSTNTFLHHQSSCSFKEGTINISSKQRSSLLQSNPSSATTINYSPKMDLRSKHSYLGNLAASRLGVGGGQTTSEGNTTNVKSFNSQTMNYMSTPNRNRLINYLRDNIEDPIMPELTFEQVWLESATSSVKASKFFTTSDVSKTDYLVFVCSGLGHIKLMTYQQSNEKDGLVFGRINLISGFDACPITSMRFMVVLDTSRTFVLYSGIDRVTSISFPQATPDILRNLPSSSPASCKNPVEMTPIQMSSARKRSSLGDRVSVGSDVSINQMFQAISPVPHTRHESKTSSPIISSDIKRIEFVVGRTVYVSTNNNSRARFEIPKVCQIGYTKSLLDSMRSVVSKELGLSIIAKWYQSRRSSTQPELMHARDELYLFKNWFLHCIGIHGNYFHQRQTSKAPDISIKFNFPSPSKKSRRVKEIEANPMIANVYALFYAMHLVFEDLLLMKLNYEYASDLADFLLVMACLLKLDSYQEYYWLKFPHLQANFGALKSKLVDLIPKVETLHKPAFFQTQPVSVMDFVNRIVTKSQTDDNYQERPLAPYPIISEVTRSSIVINLFSEMFNLNRKKSVFLITPFTDNHSSIDVLDTKPERSKEADQRVVVLLVGLGKDRDFLTCLPEAVNLYLWDSILNCRDCPPSDWSEACFKLIGRMDLVSLVRGRARMNLGIPNTKENEDETLKLIFPDDIRVCEAHRMLASDVPVEFSVTHRQGATDAESMDETHRHLYLLNVRTMAMPVGRGAISLRTYSPVIGESFEVPRLELTGRSLSEDRAIEYTHDISVYPWPFFHNGVAAGLTICASTATNIIDSTWINYNRPKSNIPHGADARDRDLTAANINNEHAGFLFALGLNGHLEKLSLMALHGYLCQNNDLTKLGVLLGMSAAKRGTRDNNIIKVLSIHVDALLPPNSTELDVSAPVHAASIIGVGLLYQSSTDSHISKVLLEEIGRLPGPEENSRIDRESYSLSAGLAFGLVNLCKGGSSTVSSSDQLRLYMLGGRRKPLTIAQRERYFKQDCHRGEEEYINTHVTSPGGTLGLGLMYHRTGNQSVANWMLAPDTQTLLEYVRPDFLILRMLSYGLIMWNEVKTTEDWINSHIPEIVSTHAFQRNSSPGSPGLVPATTINQEIDYQLISQTYCNIIAGCCMAIAIRFAGTADKNAYKTIYKHTKMLIALNNKPSLAEQAGRPCIEACLNVMVTSLAVVMAGTGDLGVMRVIRYLRSRLTHSCVFYGSYMASHMALGILFLGSCRYSLSTTPESIAALVCALYPIYPNHSSDNRYHLQALRHLYVIAAEPRLLIPRDIQSNKPTYVKVTVKKKNPDGIIELKLRAPCLMPEVNLIESICVDDERYWRIQINNKEAIMRCLLQDQGCLSVKQKAHSSNNELVQGIEEYILGNMLQGVKKSRKTAALKECEQEDRLEQYSALNDLLVNSHSIDLNFRSLQLEQLRFAITLSDRSNKINLLKAVEGEFQDKFATKEVHDNWVKYLSKSSDWTNTDLSVAYYIVLNDLRCGEQVDEELLESLKSLEIYTK